MPEQDLDQANVGVLLQQVGGKAVPQRVWRHPLLDLGQMGGGMNGAANWRVVNGSSRSRPGNNHSVGRAMRYQSRKSSSSTGESIAKRSLRP